MLYIKTCTGEITTLYYKVFAGECAEVTSSAVAGTTVTYCLWRGFPHPRPPHPAHANKSDADSTYQ
ncbi:hypothetical protein J6590_005723 [Homalodisca vitripennis]|nr:hypothetical protein J6590_005723 [Homalodisca vitripennis]